MLPEDRADPKHVVSHQYPAYQRLVIEPGRYLISVIWRSR
jgi:hypothetical protein